MINNVQDETVITEKGNDYKIETYKSEEIAEGAGEKSESFSSEEKARCDVAAKKLKYLVGTISSLIAERSVKHFVEITKVADIENIGKVLSLMQECEPYVNVLILEAVFATYGIMSGVEDMEFLYWCAENAPDLFAEFKKDFMTMDKIDELIVKIIEKTTGLDDPYGYERLQCRRQLNVKNNSNM